MPDEDPPLRLSDVPTIAAAVAEMVARQPQGDTEFGTVTAINTTAGQVPKVAVALAGHANRPIFPTVICDPTGLALGVRVAVRWDYPHQAYVIGILDGGDPPAIRVSLQCDTHGIAVTALEGCGETDAYTVDAPAAITLFQAFLPNVITPYTGDIDLLINGSTIATLTYAGTPGESHSAAPGVAVAPGDVINFTAGDISESGTAVQVFLSLGSADANVGWSGCG